MASGFDRDQLLAAFDEIGEAAVAAHTRLDIAVFGGSASMLASNFHFSTEHLDIAEINLPWPDWLSDVVARIAKRRSWAEHWLSHAVDSFLSSLAQPGRDLVISGTFPRKADKTGLTVFVPTTRYFLALKLKALCFAKYETGSKDFEDIARLLHALDIKETDAAIAIFREYFPNSVADVGKARSVLKHVLSMESPADAPS
jgi:hypothetical protein